MGHARRGRRGHGGGAPTSSPLPVPCSLSPEASVQPRQRFSSRLEAPAQTPREQPNLSVPQNASRGTEAGSWWVLW